MNIDNLVTSWDLLEADAAGKPTLVEVNLREPIARLFANDTVRWMRAGWRVWAIEKNQLTLIRLEN